MFVRRDSRSRTAVVGCSVGVDGVDGFDNPAGGGLRRKGQRVDLKEGQRWQ